MSFLSSDDTGKMTMADILREAQAKIIESNPRQLAQRHIERIVRGWLVEAKVPERHIKASLERLSHVYWSHSGPKDHYFFQIADELQTIASLYCYHHKEIQTRIKKEAADVRRHAQEAEKARLKAEKINNRVCKFAGLAWRGDSPKELWGWLGMVFYVGLWLNVIKRRKEV